MLYDKPKIYLGIKNEHGSKRFIFRYAGTPTRERFPDIACIIGPFATVRGALFMREHGAGNPHCQYVNDAERLGKKYLSRNGDGYRDVESGQHYRANTVHYV